VIYQARKQNGVHTSKHSRTGFSLIEMIVTMAIVSAVVAVVIRITLPENPNDRARTDAAADELSDLAQAMAGREPSRAPTSFRQVIGAYPSKLSQLTTKIVGGVDKGICNITPYSTAASPATPVPPGYAVNWTKPFYYRQLRTDGTITARGFTVNDALVLIGPTPSGTLGSNGATIMAMRLPSVTLRDAEALDLSVDGALSGTQGIIRYNNAIDPTSVDYYIYISGC